MSLKNKWLYVAVIIIALTSLYYFLVIKDRAVNFRLNNWDGETVTMEDLRGKVTVLTFSYSFCSVRCPVITVRLSSLDEMMNSPEDVVYLHVSTDPEADTPERRKKYFSLYRINAEKDRRWMFLSGERNQLLKVWQFYDISIEKVESDWIPEGYYMDYTPRVVIIDKKGFIKLETDFDFMEDEVAKKIGEII